MQGRVTAAAAIATVALCGCDASQVRPTPQPSPTTKAGSVTPHVTSSLSLAQRRLARQLVVQSPLVLQIARGVRFTPGGVIPATGVASDQPFRGVDVTLHFAQPVRLPLGTPIYRSFPEDYDPGHDLTIAEMTQPLERDLGAQPRWRADMNLLTGTVYAIGTTP